MKHKLITFALGAVAGGAAVYFRGYLACKAAGLYAKAKALACADAAKAKEEIANKIGSDAPKP